MTLSVTCATGEVLLSPSYYRGEQYDPDLGLYYLRARYYNPLTGRFMSRDPEDGKSVDPKSLHKYLYAGGDPVNRIDPKGREELLEYIHFAFETYEDYVEPALSAKGLAGCVSSFINLDASLLPSFLDGNSVDIVPQLDKDAEECSEAVKDLLGTILGKVY